MRFLLALLGAALVCAPTCAQSPAPAPLGIALNYTLSTGVLSNGADVPQQVWSATINVPGVRSLQLLFDTAELQSAEDAIIITNPRDGETQRLTKARLKQWRNHTAWFNGEQVDIAVELTAGSTAQLVIRKVYGGINTSLTGNHNSVCGGSDDRVFSTDNRVCRLVKNTTTACGGCTGWLISATNTILGAGHCADPTPDYFVIAQFNTPGSSGGCMVHPPVADQFPVDQSTITFANGGPGNDWAVARLHPNSSGQTAYVRQGAYFSLATSLPTCNPLFGPARVFRVTGYGYDTQPNNSYEQQTDTGLCVSYVGDAIRHTVDTEGGNSGSPIIDQATGQAIGIHTHGGCDDPAYLHNSGTSILKPALQSAINATVGCSTQFLASSQNGGSDFVSCDFQVFNVTPVSGKWVGVGITSASDWDIWHEQANSALGSSVCDFIIANGHNGTVAPTSGELNRWSGTATARADHIEAETISVGSTSNETWGSTNVLRMFEFYVSSAGSYDFTVAGSNDLKWRLFGPGSNANWRSRSSATGIGPVGIVGAGSGSHTLGTGWHCIVVFKDGGAQAVTPTSQFSITVCNSASLQSITASPATITNPCTPFSMTPTTNRWNVICIASPSDWDMAIGSMTGYTGGADYALANGRAGAISPTNGQFVRYSGSSDGTAQARGASTGSVGGYLPHTLSGTEVVEAREINIASAGSYDVTVTGDPTVSWRLHSPPGHSDWFDENDNVVTSGSANGATSTVSLGTGYHVLVMYRYSGPSGSTASLLVNVCASASTVTLTGITPQTVTTPCVPFSFSVDAGRWNAVGVQSDSDWDIAVGSAHSASGGPVTDFVIANGRNGAITPLNGVVNRYSGSDSANIMRSYNVTLSIGTAYTVAGWNPSRVIRVFEFQVTSAGNYDITMSNAAPLSWRLFDPGSDASFRRRNTSIASGSNGVTSTLSLSPGWHAIACFTDSGPAPSSFTFSMLVEQTPNPSPTTSSISPSSAIAGGSAFSLTVNGSSFVSGAQIRFGGTPLVTSYVSSSELTATVPAALIATAGTVPVDVSNPAPGGGLSGSQTFTISNPAPGIGSLSPSSAIAGSGSFQLTVNGSGFNSGSVIRWNGINLSTTYLSAGSVRATVPANYVAAAGTRNVRVFNPGPGGGLTSALTFTVENPVPTVSSTTPNLATVGSGSFLITVNGSNYNGSSTIRFDGNVLATNFVNASTVTATVPNALISTAGTVVVGVSNPAPGGGFASTNFTVENPVPSLGSLTPTFAIAGDSAFTMNVNGSDFISGDSVVLWDGSPLPTTFVSATQLQASVSATLIGAPGSANVEVDTSGPGGGTTAPVAFPILAPAIISIAPTSIPILTAASPAQLITITGANFHPGTQAYADRYALPTTFINSSTVTCDVGPSVLGALRRGGLAIAVENSHTVPSNAMACVVGGLGSNAGTITRNPLAPLPGEDYVARCENGVPGRPLLLLADLTNPLPIYPWPSPAGDFVLSVRPTQPATPDWFVLVDGIGVFGPPAPGAVYDATGSYSLGGFAVPSPPWGLTLTVQGAYTDPTTPLGFTLHWARHPDQL